MSLELCSLNLTLPTLGTPCFGGKHYRWATSWCWGLSIYVAVVYSTLVYHINCTEGNIVYSLQGSFFLLSGISGHHKNVPMGSQHGNFFKFVASISRLVLWLTITVCAYKMVLLGSILRDLYLWTKLVLTATSPRASLFLAPSPTLDTEPETLKFSQLVYGEQHLNPGNPVLEQWLLLTFAANTAPAEKEKDTSFHTV